MELPNDIKELYRHWDSHIGNSKDALTADQVFIDPTLFEMMSQFINERIDIWKKKNSGEVAPYTKDQILEL